VGTFRPVLVTQLELRGMFKTQGTCSGRGTNLKATVGLPSIVIIHCCHPCCQTWSTWEVGNGSKGREKARGCPSTEKTRVRQKSGGAEVREAVRKVTEPCPALLDKHQLYPNNGVALFS
jgi:hypothetical protein